MGFRKHERASKALELIGASRLGCALCARNLLAPPLFENPKSAPERGPEGGVSKIIVSAESQKCVNAVLRCFVENQKGAIATDFVQQ